MGHLRRVFPVSRVYGLDRGDPIDRYFIRKFLSAHQDVIRGRVLEVGGNHYTRKFGSERVRQSDVLHIVEGHPEATIIGDLAKGDALPSDAFDCFICTQTLQYIPDVDAAVNTIYRTLKPGGALLATIPCTPYNNPQLDPWGYFSTFTRSYAEREFQKKFPSKNVEIKGYGNVLVLIAYLTGMSVQELTAEELNYQDEDYQFLTTVKAIKPRYDGE
jgi:SAM-dependent methyltransferase